MRCRSFSEEDARAALAWRYPPPWDVYDLARVDPELAAAPDRREGGYSGVVSDSGRLLAWYCVGAPARPLGAPGPGDALDFGLGLAPELRNRGLGLRCLLRALADVEKRWPGRRLRATIAFWNRPALRLARRVGFESAGAFGGFRHGTSERYVVLLRNTAAVETGVPLPLEGAADLEGS